MDFWNPESIRQVVSGEWLVEPADAGAVVAGVGIDTRAGLRDRLYVALKGDRHDGHDYLAQAVDAGARMLIVSREVAVGKAPVGGVVRVADTKRALWELAGVYRGVLGEGGTRVIAVTGSNGKTTTRHLIHTVLSARFQGTQSPKSFNNDIGVPLTLLGVRRGDEFVVAELGTNLPGEIDHLAGLVRPDVVVITNIGRAHLGGLGSREAIAVEKGSLLSHVQEGGLAVLPGGEELLEPMARGSGSRAVCARVGEGKDDDVRLVEVWQDGDGVQFGVAWTGEGGNTEAHSFSLPWLGRHNALNALSAIAVGRWMGLSAQEMKDALAGATGLPMRLEVVRIGEGDRAITVINDAYNANPESMAEALRTLADYPVPGEAGRRVAVIGDMLELGEHAEAAHRAVGEFIVSTRGAHERIDEVVLVGGLAGLAGPTLREQLGDGHVHVYDGWSGDLPGLIASRIRPGDVVLLKGSRAMGLERLIPGIEGV